MKRHILVYLWLAVSCSPTIAQAESPADMILSYRLQHGERRVTMDPTLTRIAHEQAAAMAAKDRLDHDVLGRFTSRINSAGVGRAAETVKQDKEPAIMVRKPHAALEPRRKAIN
jgi:uncharacterized protein YkwD